MKKSKDDIVSFVLFFLSQTQNARRKSTSIGGASGDNRGVLSPPSSFSSFPHPSLTLLLLLLSSIPMIPPSPSVTHMYLGQADSPRVRKRTPENATRHALVYVSDRMIQLQRVVATQTRIRSSHSVRLPRQPAHCPSRRSVDGDSSSVNRSLHFLLCRPPSVTSQPLDPLHVISSSLPSCLRPNPEHTLSLPSPTLSPLPPILQVHIPIPHPVHRPATGDHSMVQQDLCPSWARHSKLPPPREQLPHPLPLRRHDSLRDPSPKNFADSKWSWSCSRIRTWLPHERHCRVRDPKGMVFSDFLLLLRDRSWTAQNRK